MEYMWCVSIHNIGMIDHVARGRGTTGVPWGGGRGYLIRPSKYGEWEESR